LNMSSRTVELIQNRVILTKLRAPFSADIILQIVVPLSAATRIFPLDQSPASSKPVALLDPSVLPLMPVILLSNLTMVVFTTNRTAPALSWIMVYLLLVMEHTMVKTIGLSRIAGVPTGDFKAT